MDNLEYIEHTAEEASKRLDYILVMVKDDERYRNYRGDLPAITIHARECSLEISKTLAKTYIKESFERMDGQARRVADGEVDFIESYKPAFRFTVTQFSIWADAWPKELRPAENLAKQAQMQVHRDAIWGEEE